MEDAKKLPKKAATSDKETTAIETAAYERALAEVAKYVGIDPSDLKKQANAPKKEMVEIDLGPYECTINGRPYRGIVKTDSATAEMLGMMAGRRRQAILREHIRTEHLASLAGHGGFETRIVKQEQL